MAKFKTYELLAKLLIAAPCHSERSEESRIYKSVRSFTSFRMTKRRVLQVALMTIGKECSYRFLWKIS
jgi:hypothetical protein